MKDYKMCGSFYYDVLMFDIDVDPSPTLNCVLVKKNLALCEENEFIEQFIKIGINIESKSSEEENLDFQLKADYLMKSLELLPHARLIPSM